MQGRTRPVDPMAKNENCRLIASDQAAVQRVDLSIDEVGMQLLKTDVISGMDMTTEIIVIKMMRG